ncbi:DMT family transporter [Mycobacterium xenopi]|uniref:DMT family transporter n=1 Tax=Mycobacterium xenopi TaxID=1789 RepID=UPI0022EB8155|nr:DMT family transporter [Mycobacterium xenopi]MDA3658269.1 DMT family transporter [Mycobacterium xenopi]
MAKVDIAALLALIAALISGAGDVIRQRSAQEITDEPVGHLQLFRMSLRDTRWWLGGVAAVASFGLQAVALALGSVVLVQALQVTALLFALPINARLTRHPVSRWEWVWAVLVAAAVAVFIVVGDPSAGVQRGSAAAWTVVAAVMGPALVLCVLGARICPGPAAAVLLAVVSASAWALFAVLTKGIVAVLGQGLGPVLHAPELYAWLVAGLVGTVFQQSSFRASALTASLPTMTVAEPVVASVLGVVVLGETLQTPGAEILVLIATVVVVVVATVALARGEAATMAASAERRQDVGLGDAVSRRVLPLVGQVGGRNRVFLGPSGNSG